MLFGLSHVSVLVLPVGFPVVANNPVGVGGRGTLRVSTGDFSVHVVIQTLEETLTKVHVSNGIDRLLEVYTSWDLAIAGAPVMLDTLKMPLVDQDNDLLSLALINLSEEILITLVYEDFLHFWEENVGALNVPID